MGRDDVHQEPRPVARSLGGQGVSRAGGAAGAGLDLRRECFGWRKDIALLRKLKHRGLAKVGWMFSFAAAAYNLIRVRKLVAIPAAA